MVPVRDADVTLARCLVALRQALPDDGELRVASDFSSLWHPAMTASPVDRLDLVARVLLPRSGPIFDLQLSIDGFGHDHDRVPGTGASDCPMATWRLLQPFQENEQSVYIRLHSTLSSRVRPRPGAGKARGSMPRPGCRGSRAPRGR